MTAATGSKYEFVHEWNDIVAFKIHESDLHQPTFEFFYNALESLLRALNVNVDNLKKDLPEHDVERLFYIRFCQYVNRLYKLYDPTFNFFYFDLIHPTTKKCLHVLKMLLNYLKFYEMSKKEVCNKANAILSKYEAALSEKNALQLKIEDNKKRSEKIDQKLEEYEIKLPEIKKKISVLTEQEQSMDQLCAKKADEIKGFETSIMNMEIKENELQENIVSDTDYESRQRIVEKMEHELHELREMCEFTRTSNMNTYALIEEASEILKNVNLVIESQKQTDYEEMISSEAKLLDSADQIVAKERKIKELKATNGNLKKQIKEMLLKIKQKENDAIKFEENCQKQINVLNQQVAALQTESNELSNQLAEVNENVDEQEEMERFLISSIRNILTNIANTFQ